MTLYHRTKLKLIPVHYTPNNMFWTYRTLAFNKRIRKKTEKKDLANSPGPGMVV